MAAAAGAAATAGGDAAADEKRAMRADVRARLRRMSEAELEAGAAAACERARQSEVWARARAACVFIADTARLREVDTAPLIRAALARGTPCYAPRVIGDSADGAMRMLRIESLDDLEPGAMGLLEPPLLNARGEPREDIEDVNARRNAPRGGPSGNGGSDADAYDLVLMPGLAFDAGGLRLGRGGGFYDRFVARLTAAAAAAGARPPALLALAYDEQVVASVPADGHDHPVDLVATPTRLIECGGTG